MASDARAQHARAMVGGDASGWSAVQVCGLGGRPLVAHCAALFSAKLEGSNVGGGGVGFFWSEKQRAERSTAPFESPRTAPCPQALVDGEDAQVRRTNPLSKDAAQTAVSGLGGLLLPRNESPSTRARPPPSGFPKGIARGACRGPHLQVERSRRLCEEQLVDGGWSSVFQLLDGTEFNSQSKRDSLRLLYRPTMEIVLPALSQATEADGAVRKRVQNRCRKVHPTAFVF